MLVHSAAEVIRLFASLEGSASTWACYRTEDADEGEVRHMPGGEGEQFRIDTRADRYRCPLPSCNGLLTVSAGLKVGHHWRHRVAPSVEHTPESLWHLAAKVAIAEWAGRQVPDADVFNDSRFTPSRNKPDVWVRWEGGSVAFEAQKSSLDSRNLALRNSRYETDGIVPAWLFAHLQAPTLLDDSSRVRLKDAHRLVAAVGPVRWFNPDLRVVITAYVQESLRPDENRGDEWSQPNLATITYTRNANAFDREVRIAVDRLDDCTLDADGLHTPTDTWIEEQAAEAQRLEDAALAAYREWLAALREDARAQAEFQPPRAVAEPTVVESPRVVEEPTGATWATRAPEPMKPRSQPPVDELLEKTCPYCGGRAGLLSEWPHWYRPPQGTTHVIACTVCELVVGSVVSEWPNR